ncbi:hypothetical protein Sango_2306900 [Sesamum angolense]|uniref:Uncharacterized protein n=1 Tax=Sesamum angolense TaxID=2727404 RepID=A0AAE1WAK8_9LAMI|nr:hypothetical protein Sango_2306900 [Sesamum angolense]
MQVVQIRSYSTDYIGTKIHRTEESGKWRFTSFYGSPEVTRRKTSWETLARLSQESFMPWLCTGDFNKVLFQQEKTGIAKPEWQICDFRNALQQSNLLDISYEGRSSLGGIERSIPIQSGRIWIELVVICQGDPNTLMHE